MAGRATVDSVRPVYPAGPQRAELFGNPSRIDGRERCEVRPIFAKLNVNANARGSCYLELRNTKVLVSVFGPRPIPELEFSETGRLSCIVQYAPFSTVQRLSNSGGSGSSLSSRNQAAVSKRELEREASIMLHQAVQSSVRLDDLQKSVVDLNCCVLEDDGSVLAALIMAASLALSSACIELVDLVAACTVLVVPADPGSAKNSNLAIDESRVYVDPCAAEQEHGSLVTVAYMPAMNLISHVTGDVEQVVKFAVEGARETAEFMRSVLKEELKAASTVVPII
eukprot:ANDGO_05292.mRNA.1 Exosome complex component RRP41-like